MASLLLALVSLSGFVGTMLEAIPTLFRLLTGGRGGCTVSIEVMQFMHASMHGVGHGHLPSGKHHWVHGHGHARCGRGGSGRRPHVVGPKLFVGLMQAFSAGSSSEMSLLI